MRSLSVIGLTAALLMPLLFLGQPVGSAPDTDPIPVEGLGFANPNNPQSGVLANGVEWEVNAGSWGPVVGHYYIDAAVHGTNVQRWTFDRPVVVEFGIKGLNIGGSLANQERIELPIGTEALDISPGHRFCANNSQCPWPTSDDSGRPVIGYRTGDNFAVSTFRFGPTFQLPLIKMGGGGAGPSFLNVTYDTPEVVIITPADGAEYEQGSEVFANYHCIGGAGVGGPIAIESCDGDVPNGDPIDTSTLGDFTFTVNTVDEHGAQGMGVSNYSIVEPTPEPDCDEDGLQILGGPGLVSGVVHELESVVEPLGLDGTVHGLNCGVVEPVEDAVDNLLGASSSSASNGSVTTILRNLTGGLGL